MQYRISSFYGYWMSNVYYNFRVPRKNACQCHAKIVSQDNASINAKLDGGNLFLMQFQISNFHCCATSTSSLNFRVPMAAEHPWHAKILSQDNASNNAKLDVGNLFFNAISNI